MKKIAIIGTGQQGASMAQALANADGYEISTFDTSDIARSEFCKIIDGMPTVTINDSVNEAVQNADVIVLATPIDRFGSVLQEIADDVVKGAIITDIGSGKVNSIKEIKGRLPNNTVYIPTHPIVGEAGNGPSSSRADMYEGATIVIVPQTDQAEEHAQIVIEKMWKDMGGKVAHMGAITHDYLYGTLSHFEHIVAFALVAIGDKSKYDYKQAGNSMLDTTRIAGGASADMWIPIFRDNNAAICASAQGFLSQLDALNAAFDSNSPAALEELLKPAHEFRKEIIEARARESLEGEIYDIAKAFDLEGVNVADAACIEASFNIESKAAMVKRSLMPAILGAAITLNAKDIEQKYLTNIKISEVANPSFKDGSAPMLNNPTYVAALLYYNKEKLQEQLGIFEQELDKLLNAIRDDNADDVRSYIDHVSAIRKDMPAHRKPEEMRKEFIFSDDKAMSALA